jgi:hypothetical protein
MISEREFQRNKLNDLAGSLVLLVVGAIGMAGVVALFYLYW